jgi:hypothetical protein
METNCSNLFASTPRLLHDLHNDFLSEGSKGVLSRHASAFKPEFQ